MPHETKRRMPWQRRVPTALVLAFVAAVSACGDGRHSAAPSSQATVVVVAHHANELAPVIGDAELDRLRDLATDPDVNTAVAHVLAAGRPGVTTVDLEPRRPNGQIERGPRTAVLVDERLAELQRSVTRAAAEGTDIDLLRALDSAARSGDGPILLLTSGLSTVDPLDLRIAGWDRDPGTLAAELATAGQLPDLTGRTVVLGGLGRTAGEQPPLGVYEQHALRAIWLAICEEAGARCVVDDGVRPADPPVSGLAPPVVAVVPAPTIVEAPGGVEVFAVPSPLLFAPDRCDLLDGPGAAAVLEPLATRLRGGGATVAISGRTAPVGPGDGVELAMCRARAAADLLRSLGVPDAAITDVRGDGTLLDPPSAARDDHGRLDPSKLAALRRVVFTLKAKEIR